jgi:hypothetical protein
LDVCEDLIIKGEIIAGNDIDAGLLLDVPVLKTKSLGLSEQIGLGELASPVSFRSFLQVSVDTHAWETENRRLNHDGRVVWKLQLKVSGVVDENGMK